MMDRANQKYMGMCKKLVEFYNRHIDWIRRTDDLELKFMNLQVLINKFENVRDQAITDLFPLLEKQREKAKNLESIFTRFNRALHLHAFKPSKKNTLKPEIDHFPSFGSLSASETLKHYEAIIHKINNIQHNLAAHGISDEAYHELEKHITEFILSLPVLTLLEERSEELNINWEQSFADMEALIVDEIDVEMKKAGETDVLIFNEYKAAREIDDHEPILQKRTKINLANF